MFRFNFRIKRERAPRIDDEDSVSFEAGTNLKSEIARITEKGGVTDMDGVEKLIQVRVIPVLDDWLEEIHRGKIGDGSITKDGDKSVDGFILISNIGRPVNRLRSHKNLEIQRKALARSLVDTNHKLYLFGLLNHAFQMHHMVLRRMLIYELTEY